MKFLERSVVCSRCGAESEVSPIGVRKLIANRLACIQAPVKFHGRSVVTLLTLGADFEVSHCSLAWQVDVGGSH